MTGYLASLLTQAFACNARVEGMKAENAQYVVRGEYPPRSMDDFYQEANQLDQLAFAMRNE